MSDAVLALFESWALRSHVSKRWINRHRCTKLGTKCELIGDRNKERIRTFADRAKPYELSLSQMSLMRSAALQRFSFAVICAKDP